MVTKYIIQMTHHRAIGDDFQYYYKGKTKSGEPVFDYRKNTALRYETQEQATQDMQMLVAANTETPSDDFSVIAVRCRA
jgi:hypothetical protein